MSARPRRLSAQERTEIIAYCLAAPLYYGEGDFVMLRDSRNREVTTEVLPTYAHGLLLDVGGIAGIGRPV